MHKISLKSFLNIWMKPKNFLFLSKFFCVGYRFLIKWFLMIKRYTWVHENTVFAGGEIESTMSINFTWFILSCFFVLWNMSYSQNFTRIMWAKTRPLRIHRILRTLWFKKLAPITNLKYFQDIALPDVLT